MSRARDLWLWALSAAAFALLGVYLTTAHGRLDFADHAIGRDFVNVWTAGRLIGEGRWLEAFDPRLFWADEHRLFDPRLPWHFWSYPPPALLLAAPFGWPSYYASLAAWSAVGLVALLPAARGFLRLEGERGEIRLLLAMLAPAVAINLGLGQNGAITAALLIGGLVLAEDRPLAGGALLGLLVFKPQIAVLLPVMVFARGRWRVMAGAIAGAAALLAVSTAVFGLESWRAFVGGTLPMQSQMLRFGRGPFQWMMPSAYMSARLLGLAWPSALLVQAPFSLFGGWLVWRAWRSAADPSVRIAVLALATFVASPQAFNYDLIPAALAALVLWRRDRSLTGSLLAAAVWATPVAMMWLARAPVAPLVLAAAAARLTQVGGALRYSPSRSARASATGEAASNT